MSARNSTFHKCRYKQIKNVKIFVRFFGAARTYFGLTGLNERTKQTHTKKQFQRAVMHNNNNNNVKAIMRSD